MNTEANISYFSKGCGASKLQICMFKVWNVKLQLICFSSFSFSFSRLFTRDTPKEWFNNCLSACKFCCCNSVRFFPKLIHMTQ